MGISIKYNPRLIEKKIYDNWIKGHYFSSYPDKRVPYTIIMPPPNVTGILHIGHILNNTIQDVLIRYARMNGYNSCWIPGTDHASIATEAKVISLLKKKGLSKELLGREKFLSFILEWTKKHQDIIFYQLKRLGCSCDWSRTQFTMSEKLSKSVIKAFVNLYDKGYVYRGNHIVNWDPKAKTTLSNEEVIYKEQIGILYYIRYKIQNEENIYVTIATTRPETMFGDTAICIHPNDIRYFSLIGKYAQIPMTNRNIPIIQDSYVDMNFGTGCLKVTPAHDFNDKNIADKHRLNVINIFNDDATLNEKCPLSYQGMDRFNARKKIVEDLRKLGFIVNSEKLKQKIGFSERTSSIVEQKLSLQWFLKMKELSIPAIKSIKNEEIKFYPSKFKINYFQWMDHIKDWNISRQLWWGHRIPAYYYGNGDSDFVVAENMKTALIKAKVKTGNSHIKYIWQDKDVLDTWFSSWLLPVSIFDGICNPKNNEICYYYPTEDMVTGSDILFFWISRMIISGFFFKKNKPFKRVYFTGIVRDNKNNKISKSLNNSPNIIDLIEKYGADAIRMGIMLKTSAGKDFHFDDKMCLQGSNFSNKIWNAFRLIKSWNIEIENKNISESEKIAMLWIKNRFYFILDSFNNSFKEYKFDESLMILYKFIWYDFCSHFLEIIKPKNKNISKIVYSNTIFWLENILKLLHPYMPFISEEIWNIIRKRKKEEALIISSWPKRKIFDKNVLFCFENTTKVISKIRHIRNMRNIPYKESLSLYIMIKRHSKIYDPIILKLANLTKIVTVLKEPVNTSFIPFSIGKDKFFLSVNKNYILHDEIFHLEKKIKYFYNLLSMIRRNLSNDKYVKFVPHDILLKERKKESDTLEKIYHLNENLKSMKDKMK
ncbi:valine--tRNA ligase [Blattabacterium cuenoti]|uniref:valine--tRNA ligase n=1 Tax=Blattabacterium cuenoti TaxID=1653831 RepID=UPI00163D32AC|nr:valine--tRNA ligase [Blattabacterium cuenoti]